MAHPVYVYVFKTFILVLRRSEYVSPGLINAGNSFDYQISIITLIIFFRYDVCVSLAKFNQLKNIGLSHGYGLIKRGFKPSLFVCILFAYFFMRPM